MITLKIDLFDALSFDFVETAKIFETWRPRIFCNKLEIEISRCNFSLLSQPRKDEVAAFEMKRISK